MASFLHHLKGQVSFATSKGEQKGILRKGGIGEKLRWSTLPTKKIPQNLTSVFEQHLRTYTCIQAAYVLYLFWQLAGGAKQFTEVHGISRAILVEAVECLGLIFFRSLGRIKKLCLFLEVEHA